MPHAPYPGCCDQQVHRTIAETQNSVRPHLQALHEAAAAQEKYDNDVREQALELAQGLLREFLSAKYKSARTSIGKKILGRLIQDLERELSIRKNLPKNHPYQKHVLGDTELAERHWEEHSNGPQKVTVEEDAYGAKGTWPAVWMRPAKASEAAVITATRYGAKPADHLCPQCFRMNQHRSPCPGHPSTHSTVVSVDLASGWCTETQPHSPHGDIDTYGGVKRCPGVEAYCGSTLPHSLHQWTSSNTGTLQQCSGIQ